MRRHAGRLRSGRRAGYRWGRRRATAPAHPTGDVILTTASPHGPAAGLTTRHGSPAPCTDEVVTLAGGAVARELPHARLVEIAGAGHYPQETAPADLLPQLQAFLEGTASFQYAENRWRQLLRTPQMAAA